MQAHGGNQTATCITAGCKTSFDVDRLEREVRDGKIPTCDNCGGLVKNDVILFGEALPARVFQCLISDRDALRGETPVDEDKRSGDKCWICVALCMWVASGVDGFRKTFFSHRGGPAFARGRLERRSESVGVFGADLAARPYVH